MRGASLNFFASDRLICQIKLNSLANLSGLTGDAVPFASQGYHAPRLSYSFSPPRRTRYNGKFTQGHQDMDLAAHPKVDWKLLFSQRSFRYFFVGIFISLFGSGMNFSGVTWHVLSATHSTVSVSFTVILYTLPG